MRRTNKKKARWMVHLLPLPVLLSGLILSACGTSEGFSSESSGGSSPSGSGSSGSIYSGGAFQTGGADGVGGSGADGGGGFASGGGDSGGVNSGGARSGGASAGGANSDGGLGDRQCRTGADCPPDDLGFPGAMAFVECASPFTSSGNTIISGVPPQPGWCGDFDCPIQAPLPEASGDDCETDTDCADAGDGSLPTASLCREGKCIVCEADADCSTALPFCSERSSTQSDLPAPTTCVGCVSHEDCGAEEPFCAYVSSAGPRCVACLSTDDCETGVCSTANTCVPGCMTDDDCSDPRLACSPNARCEPRPCSAQGDCPTDMVCTDGICTRTACESDQDCSGVCVNQTCFEDFGTCSYTVGLP